MPLRFNVDAETLDHGLLGSTNLNGIPHTVVVWLQLETLTSANCIFQKGNGSSPFQRTNLQFIDVGAGVFRLRYQHSSATGTVFTAYTATTALAVGVKYCVAVTFDQAAAGGSRCQIYLGTNVTPLTLEALTVNTDRASLDSTATYSFRWGTSGQGTQRMQGLMYQGIIIPEVLGLHALRSLQTDFTPYHRKALIACYHGRHGVLHVLDESGRGYHGIVTGPKLVGGVDLFLKPPAPSRRVWFDIVTQAAQGRPRVNAGLVNHGLVNAGLVG